MEPNNEGNLEEAEYSEQEFNLIANFAGANIELLKAHPDFADLEDLLAVRQKLIDSQERASDLVKLLGNNFDYEMASEHWLAHLESIINGNLIRCTMDDTIRSIIVKMENEMDKQNDEDDEEIEYLHDIIHGNIAL
jgi:hypothetical protein